MVTKARPPTSARPSLLAIALIGLLKLVWAAFVVALPLAGVWAASSLAAYSNGPRWAIMVAGLLLFPLLPLAWEIFAAWRRSRRTAPKPRILTFGDRILLRTLALNLLFLGLLLVSFPKVLFTALSARGDWFLEGIEASWVPEARARLFAAADKLEWLYLATHDNPYRDDDKSHPVPSSTSSSSTSPVPPPAPIPTQKRADTEEKPKPPPSEDKPPKATEEPRAMATHWPFGQEPYPAIASIPAEVEKSPEDVARYLASQEKNPVLRLKALHDYVADRIAYDSESLAAGRYPPQDAKTVFSTRKGVCAGYAKLLVAMGQAIGDEIVYVVGVSRDMGGDVSGVGHAWNAAQIEGHWYLIDATWDAGYVEGDKFVKRYSSDYLLTPPEVFGSNHLPDEAKWQLRDKPISRGEFVRQPNLRPGFHEKGLVLIDPQRSQITVQERAVVTLENPRGISILADFEQKEGSSSTRCRVNRGERTQIICELPRKGTYHVQLFANDVPVGTHHFVGQFEVNRSL